MHRLTTWILLIVLLSPRAWAENWPAWRGPHATGVCDERNLPITWGPKQNVRWKVPLPDAGNSTPIVWRDRVFLTQATERGTRRALLVCGRDGLDEVSLSERTLVREVRGNQVTA